MRSIVNVTLSTYVVLNFLKAGIANAAERAYVILTGDIVIEQIYRTIRS